MSVVLITGSSGLVGSESVNFFSDKGFDVIGIDNNLRKFFFGKDGSTLWLKNKLLKRNKKFISYNCDIRNYSYLEKIFKKYKSQISLIIHCAAQPSHDYGKNFPILDFEVNAKGTLNLLELCKIYCPDAPFIFMSTNKVYGDLENYEYKERETRYEVVGKPEGFDESCTLDFRSPYGCSKGAADQYMLDYSRNYGLKNIVFRHSSIFGGRQYSTFDQGWVGWFIKQALVKKSNKKEPPFEIFGNGKQVRDILFSPDLINCYFSAISKSDICSGLAFNIGGGMTNSLSLIELFNFLEEELQVKLNFDEKPWRTNDQKVFVADTKKALKIFFSCFQGVEKSVGFGAWF